MKNYLLLLLLVAFSIGAVSAQKEQKNAIISDCSVTSNFNSANGCDDISSYTTNIKRPSSCGITINGIYELNALGDANVAFHAPSQLQSGWNITSSTFTLTYQNNSTSVHSGFVNFLGNPQITIPVSCNNKVIKVEVTVFAGNSSGANCSDTKIQNFPLGVCGTSGFVGF